MYFLGTVFPSVFFLLLNTVVNPFLFIVHMEWTENGAVWPDLLLFLWTPSALWSDLLVQSFKQNIFKKFSYNFEQNVVDFIIWSEHESEPFQNSSAPTSQHCFVKTILTIIFSFFNNRWQSFFLWAPKFILTFV